MFADSFAPITTMADDPVVLIASLITLGLTILAWKLGSSWILSITSDGRENYYRDECQSDGEDDGDWNYFMDRCDESDNH